MSNVIKSFLPILLLLLCSYCVKEEYDKKEDFYEIITIVIDEYAHPIPSPPEEGLNDSVFKIKSDSLYKIIESDEWKRQKLKVGVYPIAVKENWLRIDPKDFGDSKNLRVINMFNHSGKNSTVLNFKMIKSAKKNNIIEADTMLLKEGNYRNYDIVFNFSNIIFNQKKDRAILIVEISRGKLNGYSIVLVLKKENKTWGVIEKKTLSIS